MYSDALLDHFQNPRNSGELPKATHTIKCENPVCGDVLQLALLMEGDRIAAVRFKAQGCVPSMACASALTTLLAGRQFNAVQSIRREDLLHLVGGIPPGSVHAVDLAMDALRRIILQTSSGNSEAGY